MKKYLYSTFPFSFLLVIFIFIIDFPFAFAQNKDFLEYFNGEKITSEKESNKEINNCLCDTDPTICDEFCCCDEECPEEAINEWRNHTKCIDEKDTVINFADRCIDKNLVFRFNKQRGIQSANQTEDLSKKEGTITNYCYSMDNARKVISNSESSSNETERENKISDYIDEQFFGIKKEDISAKKKDEGDKQYMNVKINPGNEVNDIFKNSGQFSLFSGVTCSNTKNVEFLIPENHTCLMGTNSLNELKSKILDQDFKISLKVEGKEYTLKVRNKYKYDDADGLLNIEPKGNVKTEDIELILEIEFILNLENKDNGSINFVFTGTDISKNGYYTFKNSIVFSNNENVPYRYSGNGGYLNGFPLKICDINNIVYNEYYIVGRSKDGKCRSDESINNYLYYFDIPFIFNKNYIYSCQKEERTNQLLKDSTLYNKIKNINKVGKYGSSSYTNLNDKNDWLELDKSKINNVKDNDNTITMKFFIGTKKGGIYSHKYIDSIDISTSDKSQNDHFTLEILYYDLEEDPIYNKEPDIPTFVPRIPPDILDPLLYSEVDK